MKIYINIDGTSYQVSFIPMGQLLYITKDKGVYKHVKNKIQTDYASDLIIIDDVMNMAYETEGAQLQDSIYFNINKGLGECGKFLGDTTLTTVILDRLFHRSEIITFDENTDELYFKKLVLNLMRKTVECYL
ncbi:ATP-binding protein [Oceanobacillus kimchii]|uniref:ATP-binding protein n=1 Tax=Oceanobacillus kimchii TaxID=746691 RepID=UPI000985B279|nr:ATP-binding protein [Oceanobacillus kimchii]